jgi:hypothetical protein
MTTEQRREWKRGDYALDLWTGTNKRALMKILGRDTFGQLVAVYVRQRHWKKVPRHCPDERKLADPAEYGVEVPV